MEKIVLHLDWHGTSILLLPTTTITKIRRRPTPTPILCGRNNNLENKQEECTFIPFVMYWREKNYCLIMEMNIGKYLQNKSEE